MLFNSWKFMLFFPAAVVLYRFSPARFRWAVLLALSLFFYMVFNPYQILIILAMTAANYGVAILMEKAEDPARRRYVVAAIVIDCAFLFVFKYFNFFFDSVTSVASLLGVNITVAALRIIVPVGISYITFQLLSYVVEVYRKKQNAERHPGIFLLYVLLFNKVLSGPIERPGALLPQLHAAPKADAGDVAEGLKIMAWGFFKKVVIADRLAIVVNRVYGNVNDYSGFSLMIAVIFYTFQLYYDFSGYTDIAIGSARVLGYRLTQNFDRPLFAHSITDLWRRWHISLSSWIRDYLYTPIVLNRRHWGKVGIVFALVVAFTLCGLWHGASWNFVLFGFFNGVGLSIEMLVMKSRKRLNRKMPAFLESFLNIGITFLYFTFTLIFFRAATTADSWYIVTHLFADFGRSFIAFLSDKSVVLKLGLGQFEFKLALLLVVLAQVLEFMQRRGTLWEILAAKPSWIRWGAYYLILLGLALFGVYSGKVPFIYFQF
jgi:alginate O-acetyltransferase complex protein AlgI